MATAREVAVQLAQHGVEAATAYGRPDLAARLEVLRAVAVEPTVRVLVVGEFKQGKSSLVNALVGADVCPIDDDIATSLPTLVRFAEPSEVVAVLGDDGDVARQPVEVGQLAEWVTEGGAHSGTTGLQHIEVGIPSQQLRDGLVLVDMPGVGGLGTFHGASVLAAADQAHGVLFTSDSVQELTAPELEFLTAVATRSGAVALVKTKTDLHPEWRRIVERDRGHAGSRASLVSGVSSALATRGAETDDGALVQESGLHDVIAWLHEDVVGHADVRIAATIASNVAEVCDRLRAPFVAEHAALVEDVDRNALEARLEMARTDAARMRTAASRWQQVLGDQFSDLTGDADHELRAKVRDLTTRSEAAIDAMDPATAWETYEPTMRRELREVVAEHRVALRERVAAAAERITDVFDEDAAGVDRILDLALSSPDTGMPARLETPAELGKVKRTRLPGQALGLAKATYGPSLMIGFAGSLLGITLAAPAMLAVGLVMGGKNLRTENERQLTARRTQAKGTVRRFVDDVIFQVAKDARDEGRHAQRALRDHFSGRAEELVRSANAALTAAQAAAGGDDGSRAKRRAAVAAELKRIAWLAQVAEDLRVETAR